MPKIGEVSLSVRDLALEGVFNGVSFDLRRGEILGMAGLVGAGRTNVAETIFGVTPATAGEIRIDGKPVTVSSPKIAMEHGLALLTEDRKATGLFLMHSVLENMQIASVRTHTARRLRPAGRVQRLCASMKDTLRIKTPTLKETIGNLSGGNQQKALIARWLMTNPRMLILDEPTRGIDVGAKAEIHRLISRPRRPGHGDHHDLLGDAGGPGHEGPHHGHARGPRQRLPRPFRSHPGEDHAAGRKVSRAAPSDDRRRSE